MSRPTRNETLEALEWADPKTDYEYKVVQAAKAYAAMAPDTCPDCRIKSQYVTKAKAEGRTDFFECGTCGGRGYVWPDTLVSTIAKNLHASSSIVGHSSWETFRENAVYMLDAVWEVSNDN